MENLTFTEISEAKGTVNANGPHQPDKFMRMDKKMGRYSNVKIRKLQSATMDEEVLERHDRQRP